MARNTNVRCIRVSEEMDELINQQIGDTYTAKFTNLVTRCIWELPQKEAQLQQIQERIDRERQRLRDLQRATEQLRLLENDLETARRYFKYVERRAKSIAEASDL